MWYEILLVTDKKNLLIKTELGKLVKWTEADTKNPDC